VTIFCHTKRFFVDSSITTVKKMGEVWRKMGLFGPDSVPLNQLFLKYLTLGSVCVFNFELLRQTKLHEPPH
jgi:hypothetical protein